MVPLVLASIIQGIAGESGRGRLARLGVRVVLYFIVTTLVAIVVGAAASLTARPARSKRSA